jgi:hypothetical protein
MHRSNPNPSFHVSTHATNHKSRLQCNHLLERIGVSSPPCQEERQANCLKDWAIISGYLARFGGPPDLPRARAPTATVSRGRFSVKIWAMN